MSVLERVSALWIERLRIPIKAIKGIFHALHAYIYSEFTIDGVFVFYESFGNQSFCH